MTTRALWPAPVLIAIIGLAAAFLTAGAMTVLQNATSGHRRGRVFGAMAAAYGAAMLLGTIAAGILAERVGILPVIVTQGAAYCLAGMVVLLALPRPTLVHGELASAVPVGHPSQRGAWIEDLERQH